MTARNLKKVGLDEAAGMLGFVSPDDREIWVKLGGIMKSEYGDAGFGIWDQRSATSDRYVEKDARAVWRSLKNSGKCAGIGTLIYLSRQNGWRAGAEPSVNLRNVPPRPAPPPQNDTSAYAARLWLSASCADAVVGTHPYAGRKGITWAAGAGRGVADGKLIGRGADCVIVPIRTDAVGKVQGVQAINADGVKQTFGKLNGGCLALGNTLDLSIPWFVAEGWASAASVVFHHHRGAAVCAVAFGKHNMMPAAELLARVFNPPEIVVLQEQDE